VVELKATERHAPPSPLVHRPSSEADTQVSTAMCVKKPTYMPPFPATPFLTFQTIPTLFKSGFGLKVSISHSILHKDIERSHSISHTYIERETVITSDHLDIRSATYYSTSKVETKTRSAP
jgi:hypothetical protein